MDKNDIHLGHEYGYRELPKRHDDLQRVRVLERVRSQWKVEWVEPDAGLQDYVKSVNLVVPWKERRAFLREEKYWDRLHEVGLVSWPGDRHPLSDAVDTVLESSGELVWVHRGVLSGDPDALAHLSQRAQSDLTIEPPGFVDRAGEVHLPFDSAVQLAMALAAQEPQTVLLQVETVECEYEAKAREVGSGYLVPLVQQWRAGWALCRQWAGFDQAIARREAEIERLRRIIDDLRYELIRSGQEDLAETIKRKLRR